jgi:hypothetical protein
MGGPELRFRKPAALRTERGQSSKRDESQKRKR